MTAKPTARKRTAPFQGVPHGKLTRLVAKWHREADELSKMLLGDDGSAVLRTTLAVRSRYLRQCATQLSRILKP